MFRVQDGSVLMLRVVATPNISIIFEGLAAPLPLADAVALTHAWDATNRRRVQLIDKEIVGTLGTEEARELKRLQELAWAKRNMTEPLPWRELDLIQRALEKEAAG